MHLLARCRGSRKATTMANKRPNPGSTPRRAPSVAIAFRTLGRTLRHGYDNIGTLLLSSLFWYAGALLILPLGVATAGLHRVTRPMTEERAAHWRSFFTDARADLRWSSVLMATLILGVAVLEGNIRFYSASSTPAMQWVALPFRTLMLIWIGITLFAFPLAIRQQDRRLRTTLRNALIMVVANAPGILLSLILLALLMIVLLVLPPLFLVLPGAAALWGQENARLLLVATGDIPPDEVADRPRGAPPKDDFSPGGRRSR